MHHVRALATIVVCFSLAALFVGLSMEQAYSIPQSGRTCLSAESFVIPANSTSYKTLSLNQSGNYYVVIYGSNSSNIIFSSQVSDDNLQKWLQGQVILSWNCVPQNGGFFNLPYLCASYPFDVNGNSGVHDENIAFWNSRNFTQQANLAIYKETLAVNQSGLNLSWAVTAVGSAGILAVASFFFVKNRASLKNFKITRKKTLILLASVLMLTFGVYLAETYSSPVNVQTTIAHGTVNVPANSWQSIAYVKGSSGIYLVDISADRGTILVFQNGENSTFMHWSNGTNTDIRGFSRPAINASSGQTGEYVLTNCPAFTTYLILSNIDTYSKNISYTGTYHWTYKNNFAYIAGVALTAIGAILLTITLLGNKLRAFNKALENQE